MLGGKSGSEPLKVLFQILAPGLFHSSWCSREGADGLDKGIANFFLICEHLPKGTVRSEEPQETSVTAEQEIPLSVFRVSLEVFAPCLEEAPSSQMTNAGLQPQFPLYLFFIYFY